MKFEERYKLQVPIEQTERGTLWSGQDTKVARKVVVAVVEADAPEALRERFAEQMGKLAALRHANLVRVLEVGRTEEDAPFASMESAEGDTLAKRMLEGPPMRVDQAVRMIADLCGALSALHAAGIAHGDLHPGSVLVKELGGRVTPKLAGVGLNAAEQRRGDEEPEELNALAYMAPAQARGEVLADAASDVYSTAAIVFSLLTGRLPHRGGSAEGLRQAVKDQPAPSAADVRAELAGPIAEVLDAALSPEPDKRFATADALAKALRTALIRTRTPGALETVVGARALEADESDVALAEKRSEKSPARGAPRDKAPAPAARAIPKPGASKGIPPSKPLPQRSIAKDARALAQPHSAAAPIAPDDPPAKAAASAREEPEPASAESGAQPARDESLEFERLSGLLDVSDVFAGAAPPPPPKDAAKDGAPARKDESLEFERLSGLLEIGDMQAESGEKAPPPPPAASSAAAEAAEEPVASGEPSAATEEAREDASAEAASAAPSDEEAADTKAPIAVGAPIGHDGDDEPRADPPSPPPAAAKVAAANVAAEKVAAEEVITTSAAPAKSAGASELFEAEEIAGMSSGPPPWVWAAVGIGLAVAIVVGGVAAFSGGDDPSGETALAEPPPATTDVVDEPESSEDVTATAAPSEPPPVVAAPAEPAPEEPAISQVTLTLTGVPAGATVTIDGEAVEGTEIALDPSEEARTVAVRLAGHEDWSQSVPGDASADLQVELVEVAEAEEPRGETRAARRRASRTERARASRARTERARTERSRTERARPPRRTRRRGSRPTAVSDPGF